MAFACSAPEVSGSLVQDLALYLQCHASGIGELGYQAFASGPLLSALLASCLTIYIALFGYRLLLGQDVDLKDLVVATVRVGFVMALALHWNSYQAVVYGVVTEGPAELANVMLQPEGLSATTLADAGTRLESVYERLEEAPFLVGPNAPGSPPSGVGLPAPSGAVAMAPNISAQPGNIGFRPPLNPGGLLLIVSILGPLAAVQMAAGILLGLGPVVIVLALFDPFLGLLEGWLRALGAALLGSAALILLLALELDFLESEVVNAATSLHNDADVFATAVIFSLLAAGALAAAGIAAAGFRIFPRNGRLRGGEERRAAMGVSTTPSVRRRFVQGPQLAPSRAQVVADAVTMRTRREQSLSFAAVGPVGSPQPGRTPRDREASQDSAQPLGYSLRGSTKPRRSLSISRRNSR